MHCLSPDLTLVPGECIKENYAKSKILIPKTFDLVFASLRYKVWKFLISYKETPLTSRKRSAGFVMSSQPMFALFFSPKKEKKSDLFSKENMKY